MIALSGTPCDTGVDVNDYTANIVAIVYTIGGAKWQMLTV